MDKQQRKFDLIVLGAGPAGCALAITAVNHGLQVVLVDRKKFPRFRPGETLHPGIEPLLAQLGVWKAVQKAAFVRHSGIEVEQGSHTFFQAYGEDWKGLQAPRDKFDRLLLERCRDLGVSVLEGKTVQEVIESDGKIEAIETQDLVIFGKWFADCTGHHQGLGRRLGLRNDFFSPRLWADFGYYEGSIKDRSPRFSLDEFGCHWLAQIDSETIAWVGLNRDASLHLEPPPELMDLTPRGPRRRREVTWSLADPLWKENWLMAGDAALQIDPAGGNGVIRALMTGIYAGWLLGLVEEGRLPVASARKEYRSWTHRLFHAAREPLQRWYQDQLGWSFDSNYHEARI